LEGPTSDLVHLEGAHHPAGIRWQDHGGCCFVTFGKDSVKARGPNLIEDGLPPGANRRVRPRETQVIKKPTNVKARTTDDHGGSSCFSDSSQSIATCQLVTRDAEIVSNVDDVNQVVGHSPALRCWHLCRTDIHAPVHLKGIGVDYLGVQGDS
jgi:hypothetical protein